MNSKEIKSIFRFPIFHNQPIQSQISVFFLSFYFSIHGNEIGDAGLKILQPSLMNHPHILSLDVGDCGVGDEGLDVLCRLLVRTHDRPGI